MSKSIFFLFLALLAVFGGSVAHALADEDGVRIDRVLLNASMQSGVCRDTFTGEAETTQSASLEYRHESENFSALGRGVLMPSGGNCAEQVFSYDGELERRFAGPAGFYGIARLGAAQHIQTGVFRHVSDGLVLFANQTDGGPSYTALAGVGRCFGAVCIEGGYNLAYNDYWRNGRPWSGQSVHGNLTYTRDLLGGQLEIAFEAEGPRPDTIITGQRISWTRALHGRFDVSFGWRRTGGLSNLRSPFPDSIVRDGRRYFLGATDDAISTIEFGFGARL